MASFPFSNSASPIRSCVSHNMLLAELSAGSHAFVIRPGLCLSKLALMFFVSLLVAEL